MKKRNENEQTVIESSGQAEQKQTVSLYLQDQIQLKESVKIVVTERPADQDANKKDTKN
jgi:Zn ribbon nucleic-acid-binding protein